MRLASATALIAALLLASIWIFSSGVLLFGDVGKFIVLPFVIYFGHIVIETILDMYHDGDEE